PRLSTLFPYTTLFRSQVDGEAEQQQLQGRDADDHGETDAIAAQLAQFLEHDRQQPAQVHAGLPGMRVAATNTSSRLASVGCTVADRKSTRLNSSHVKI